MTINIGSPVKTADWRKWIPEQTTLITIKTESVMFAVIE
jgi:hypothetical protein